MTARVAASTSSKRKPSMNNIELEHPKIVSQDKWLVARKAHLEREKALTRLRDQVSAERRELPWVKIQRNYVFDTPNGKQTLDDLFDGRSQLIVYHFMLGRPSEMGRRVAKAARSLSIMSTARTFTSRTTM